VVTERHLDAAPGQAREGAEATPDVRITGELQHEHWRRRDLPPVEQLAADLWSIPIPMDSNPLRYVLVYALASESSVTLVDAGWDSDRAWAALGAGLAAFGADITDISACLVTHEHFDHLGLARRIRAESGAWVGLHPADKDQILHPEFRDSPRAVAADARWYRYLGAPSAEARALAAREKTYDPRSHYAIPDRLLNDADLVSVPEWQLRVIHTPGHTPGHICFYHEPSKRIFGGDHLLPRISPNVSADRRQPHASPLDDFLESLDKVARIPATAVCPAHEWRFSGVAARVHQLKHHHEARLNELLDIVRRRPGQVPWTLAGDLTWSRSWDEYSGFMRTAAVGETMAHLVYLVRHGFVVASGDEVPTYRALATAAGTRVRLTGA
jgi:glyoxylase-like metal-dependent hydrolase (beta-lactamase superfamily II)